MGRPSNARYIALGDQDPKLEKSDVLSDDESSCLGDEDRFLKRAQSPRKREGRSTSSRVAKIMAVANVLLTVLLLATWITLTPWSRSATNTPEPPYC